MFKQPHTNTSRRINYHLHRDRTGRDGQKTLILLYCLRGGPQDVGNASKQTPTWAPNRDGESFTPRRRAPTAILMLVYEFKLDECVRRAPCFISCQRSETLLHHSYPQVLLKFCAWTVLAHLPSPSPLRDSSLGIHLFLPRERVSVFNPLTLIHSG